MFLIHLFELFFSDTHNSIAYFSCEFFCPCQEGINDEECLCNEILRITETCVLIKHSLNNYFLSSLVGIAETQMSFGSLVIARFFFLSVWFIFTSIDVTLLLSIYRGKG